MPISFLLIPYLSKNALKSLISCFSLTITLRIINQRKALSNTKYFIKYLHVLTLEIFTIVHDQSLQNSKPSDDIFDEECNELCLSNWFHRDGFYPFGVIFYSYDNKLVSISRMWIDHTNQINTPCRKGPWRIWNGGLE